MKIEIYEDLTSYGKHFHMVPDEELEELLHLLLKLLRVSTKKREGGEIE